MLKVLMTYWSVLNPLSIAEGKKIYKMQQF